ncbi:MAG TPA: PilZ domain-containing protein [Gammaproteobacteria bacterium]|nr:PilZ domain-containing protein [Gammaproteobacteria bacterium]
MEHRMDMRFPLRLHAAVFSNDNRLEGITQDLSFEGACVQLAPTQDIKPQLRQPVRVQLDLGTSTLELTAMVVRVDEQCIGLMFGRYSNAAEQQLGTLFTGWADRYGSALFGQRTSAR